MTVPSGSARNDSWRSYQLRYRRVVVKADKQHVTQGLHECICVKLRALESADSLGVFSNVTVRITSRMLDFSLLVAVTFKLRKTFSAGVHDRSVERAT